jgi:hypothetical protein
VKNDDNARGKAWGGRLWDAHLFREAFLATVSSSGVLGLPREAATAETLASLTSVACFFFKGLADFLSLSSFTASCSEWAASWWASMARKMAVSRRISELIKGLRVSTASSPNVVARSARSVFLFNWQQNGMSRRMITTSETGVSYVCLSKLGEPRTSSTSDTKCSCRFQAFSLRLTNIQDRAVRHSDCSADALFDVLSHELFRGRSVRHFLEGALAHF